MKNSNLTILQDLRDLGREIVANVRDSFTIGKRQGLLMLAAMTLFVLCFLVAAVVAVAYKLVRDLVLAVRAGYRGFLHRHFDNIGLVGGFVVVVATSYGLYLLDPQTPTLSLATVQVLVSAPLLLFMEVHTALWAYKHLLPDQFKQLMGELGEKLNETVLPPVEQLLPAAYGQADVYNSTVVLASAKFKLQYHVVKFAIRCTRFVLFGAPLYLLFKAMEFNINLVLGLQPR
jgi:hypothetical protein